MTNSARNSQANAVKNRCFACGPENPEGMRLKFTYDEAGQRFLCKFRPPRRFTGPPGHLHGGIIATILDEVMGKWNRLRQVYAMTREMTVEYLKPVPLGKVLVAEAREETVRGRLHIRIGEIRNETGELLARSRGKFIAVDTARTLGNGSKSGQKRG
jgi:uncharacterized protein (TIGR00369 family)